MFTVKTAQKTLILLSSFLVLYAPISFSEGDETEFEEITVVAPTQAPEDDSDVSDTTNTVWYVDAEDIKREMQGGSDLKGALGRLIPGMDFSSESSRSNVAQGIRGRPVLVLIDGVSLNSTRGISRQFDSINAFNIDRIEVVSGATSIYGAGARGGVINIITKKGGDDGWGGEAFLSLNSNLKNSETLAKHAAFSVYNGNEKYQARFAVATEKLGAVYNGNNEQSTIDSLQTDIQFNQGIDVMGSVLYRPTEQQAISTTYQYYDSEQRSPYGNYMGDQLLRLIDQAKDPEFKIVTKKGLELDYPARTRRHFFNLKYNNADFYGQSLSAQAYYRYESFRYFPFPSELKIIQLTSPDIPFSSSEQNSEIYGAKVGLKKDFGALKLHYGLDASQDEFFARQRFYETFGSGANGGLVFILDRILQRYPHTTSRYLGAFAQARYDVNQNIKLTGGVRAQYNRHKVAPFVPVWMRYLVSAYPNTAQSTFDGNKIETIPRVDQNDVDVLLNAGINYTFDQRQQMWGNISQGLELLSPSQFFTAKYDDTKSWKIEKTNTNMPIDNPLTTAFELGYRFSNPHLMIQISPYYSISDKTFKVTPEFTLEVKDKERHIYGVEGQVKTYFGGDYSAGIMFHYNKGRVKTDDGWEGLTVFQASPNTARLTIGRDTGQWGLNASYNHLYTYNDDPRVEDINVQRDYRPDPKIPGYGLVNIDGYYELPRGRLKFGINNVMNKNYQTIWSAKAQDVYSGVIYLLPNSENIFTFYGPGRTYSLSYELDF